MRGAGDCTPTPGTLYSRLGCGGPLAPSSSWAPIPHKGMLWAPPPLRTRHPRPPLPQPPPPKVQLRFPVWQGRGRTPRPRFRGGPSSAPASHGSLPGHSGPCRPLRGQGPGLPASSCLSHAPAGCRAHGMCGRKAGRWRQGGNPGSPAPLSWLPSAERLRVAVVTLARNCHLFCFETVVQLCELFQGRGEGRGARPKPPSVVAETGPRCPHLRQRGPLCGTAAGWAGITLPFPVQPPHRSS